MRECKQFMNFLCFFVIWLSKTPTGGGREKFLYKNFSIFRRNGILMFGSVVRRFEFFINIELWGVYKCRFRDLPVRTINFFIVFCKTPFSCAVVYRRENFWIIPRQTAIFVACLWRNFWKRWKIDSKFSNRGVRGISQKQRKELMPYERLTSPF